MKQRLIPLMLISFLLYSCWAPESMREEEPVLNLEQNELILPGDNEDGSPVRDTITISSNRSWSASVVSGEDWLEIDTDEILNLDECTKDVRIALKAADNRGQRRTAGILFSASGVSGTIDVVQESRIPRLDVKERADYSSVSPDAATYPLTVLSNMPWTAELSSSSVGYASLDLSSGEGSGTVNVTLTENGDGGNTRTTEVVFKAAGCDDVVVALVQGKGVPYFRFEDEDALYEAAPAHWGYTIAFSTNVNWTASVEAYDGFSKVTLSKSAGNRDDKSLSVNFPPAVCFGKTASAKVKFTAEGAESKMFEIRQEPAVGAVIIDPFTGRVVTSECWPFSDPLMKDTPTTKLGNTTDRFFGKFDYLVLENGYKIGLYSKAGMWYKTDTGLNCGGGAGNYIESPAIEGRKLVKVYLKTAAPTPKRLDFSVCGSDRLTPLKGGEQVSLTAKQKDNTWILGGTESGEKYYLVNASTGNFYMAEVVFYYE